MIRSLSLLAAMGLASQPAAAFDEVPIGDWTVSQYVGGESPVCEASTTKDGIPITLRLLAGVGDAVVHVSPSSEVSALFDNEGARAELALMTDTMQAVSFAGPLLKEDHTGGFEAVFPDRTKVVAGLLPSSWISLRLIGDKGWHLIDITGVGGAQLSKALNECIDDLETPEMRELAHADILKASAPIQDDVQFATFIDLAYKIGRIAEACSRSGVSFSRDEVAALDQKRKELEAAWKAPSEAALSQVRQSKLEMDALLSDLTTSDCPKLRLSFDGYMTAVFKVNPEQLMTVPN